MAKTYDDAIVARLLNPHRKEFEDPDSFLLLLLKKKDVAAELGAGPGYYTKHIVKHVAKLYAVDKNSGFVKYAKRTVRSNKIIFLEEDSSRTSIPSKSVDVVILANAFHDMDREATKTEIYRILKSNGRVIIVDWRKTGSENGPPLRLRMDVEDYLNCFSKLSAKVHFEVGPFHYGIVLGQTPPCE